MQIYVCSGIVEDFDPVGRLAEPVDDRVLITRHEFRDHDGITGEQLAGLKEFELVEMTQTSHARADPAAKDE